MPLVRSHPSHKQRIAPTPLPWPRSWAAPRPSSPAPPPSPTSRALHPRALPAPSSRPSRHHLRRRSSSPCKSRRAQAQPPRAPKRAATSADSTDWVASSLTRRFGIGAGLAWVGFLAFGVVSEQLKTRFEVAQQQANTKDVVEEQEVVLPNGIRYTEMRVGGGDVARPGDLVVIDLQGRVAGGDAFVDTFGDGKRPLALVMGSRPYTRGMCEGIEYVLRSMRNGGKRRVVIPASLGFGEDGADFGDEHVQVPPGATLEYVVQVDKVSIAPA